MLRTMLCLLAILINANLAHADTISGIASVIDGNRLAISGTVLRLHGIEAPESNQRCKLDDGKEWFCGRSAAAVLELLAHRRKVTCRSTISSKADQGPERRVQCRVGDSDVGSEMIRRGMAWAAPDADHTYKVFEIAASRKRQGIFQAPTERASNFRERRWKESQANSPGACPIKGNIDPRGRRVYHLPWSQWYALTKISTSRGERWFCSEKEAAAAGWQRAAWNFVPLLDPEDMPSGGVLENQR